MEVLEIAKERAVMSVTSHVLVSIKEARKL